MDRIARLLAVTACTGMALSVGGASASEANVTVVKAGTALNAMKVVRDKETGKLRAPTDDEMAELSQAPNAYGPGVTILNRPAATTVNHADGSATVRRSLEELDSLVATRSADGKTVLRHRGASNPTLPKE